MKKRPRRGVDCNGDGYYGLMGGMLGMEQKGGGARKNSVFASFVYIFCLLFVGVFFVVCVHLKFEVGACVYILQRHIHSSLPNCPPYPPPPRARALPVDPHLIPPSRYRCAVSDKSMTEQQQPMHVYMPLLSSAQKFLLLFLLHLHYPYWYLKMKSISVRGLHSLKFKSPKD